MKDLDWIVELLIDLHSFCEMNGLDTLSDRLADAIEEAAPLIRGNRVTRDAGRERAMAAPVSHPARARNRPFGPLAFGDLRLVPDAAIGAPE